MNAIPSAARPPPMRPLVAPEMVPAVGFDRWRTSMIASSNMALTSMAREPSCTSTADGSKPGGGVPDDCCGGANCCGGGANGDGTGCWTFCTGGGGKLGAGACTVGAVGGAV